MKKNRKIARRMDRFLQSRSPKYKLWRISRAIGIKPYQWQKDYALGRTTQFGGGTGRATGKTTAVMLRILMMDYILVQHSIFSLDPDWIANDRYRTLWYIGEYRRLSSKCAEAEIMVPTLPMQRIGGRHEFT